MTYSYDRTADADVSPARIQEMADAFAHFALGNREIAVSQLKYLARVLPNGSMLPGDGSGGADFEELRNKILMALKRAL